MNCDRAKRVIDAGHDGELDPATDGELRQHLVACPSCSDLFGEREALRRALRSLPRHRAPERLRAAIGEGLSRLERPAAARRQAPTWRQAAALAGVAAAISFAAGWWIALPGSAGDSHGEAIARHVAYLAEAVSHRDVASADRHVVKPWFAGRIDFSPPVRDLAAAGYALLGGRIEQVGGSPTAVVQYRIRAHEISLFVSKSRTSRAGPMQVSTPRGFTVVTWAEEGLELKAISDVDPKELLRFAALVRAGSSFSR